MGSREDWKGLDLDQGLCFEGRLTDSHAGLIGAYAMATLNDPTRTPLSVTLKGLRGNIMGTLAIETDTVYKRRLTAAPVVGDFCLTTLSSFDADVDLTKPDAFDVLNLHGLGVLHIPDTNLYSKYRQVAPGSEYLTNNPSIDDYLWVHMDDDGGLSFQTSIQAPCIN